MNGMEIMLRSLGLDLPAIEKRVGEFATLVKHTLENFDVRLSALERSNEETNQILHNIEAAMTATLPEVTTRERKKPHGSGSGN